MRARLHTFIFHASDWGLNIDIFQVPPSSRLSVVCTRDEGPSSMVGDTVDLLVLLLRLRDVHPDDHRSVVAKPRTLRGRQTSHTTSLHPRSLALESILQGCSEWTMCSSSTSPRCHIQQHTTSVALGLLRVQRIRVCGERSIVAVPVGRSCGAEWVCVMGGQADVFL